MRRITKANEVRGIDDETSPLDPGKEGFELAVESASPARRRVCAAEGERRRQTHEQTANA
jgi:hypothetical protein